MHEFSMSFSLEGFSLLETSSDFSSKALVTSLCLFGVLSILLLYCRSNQSFANVLLLRLCCRYPSRCSARHVYPTLRIVSKVVILRRFL